MEISNATPVTLTLNVAAVGVILTSLGTQPYEKVAGLINLIQQQTATQLAPSNNAAPPQEAQE